MLKWAFEPHSACYLTPTRVHSIINLTNDRHLYISQVKALQPHCRLSVSLCFAMLPLEHTAVKVLIVYTNLPIPSLLKFSQF